MKKQNKKIFGLILLSVFIIPLNLLAQNKQDTVETKTKKIPHSEIDTVKNELILEEINIKGEIDRPNVIIMPKRVETDIKKIDLKREFSQEINTAEGEIPELNEKLRTIENIKSIKKMLKRDRVESNKSTKEKKKEDN